MCALTFLSSTVSPYVSFFFFNDTAPTEIYTLSLHDALPISTVLVTVNLRIALQDRAGKILYQNANFVFREPYEISVDISSFFQEEGPALGRMSRDFAGQVVSEILEKF